MSAVSDVRPLSARDLEPILAVAAKLAAPFDVLIKGISGLLF